ncbi:MAG TPA: addiction module protein [Campylobacterales bacterium]|nr:addiction module protein [Campylobacterales bacterium]
MQLAQIPEIMHLSTAEKILLVEDLWDSVVKNESEVEMLASHKQELMKRFEKYKSVPSDQLLTLEQLQKRINLRK